MERRLLLANLILIFIPVLVFSAPVDAPKVFIESKVYVDTEHIRSEIDLVNYVIEPVVCDVYLVITGETTASGGMEYSFEFQGRNEFDGMNFTVGFIKETSDSDEVRNEGIRDAILRGLYPFLLKTPYGKELKLDYKKKTVDNKVEDPWKSWLFKFSFSNNLSGSENATHNSIYGTFNASKVTTENEFSLNMSYSDSRSEYQLTDGGSLENHTISRSLHGKYVHGLGEHWSLGGYFGWQTSEYSNLKQKTYLKPTLEYSFFPYSKVDVHNFKLKYSIISAYYDYYEITIYDKLSETLFSHTAAISYNTSKDWGDLILSLSGSTYFHDLSKNSLNLYGYIYFRITKNIGLNISASYSFVRDQMSLPKADATDEEILLSIRELESSYGYYTYVGISYKFGSIYNNAVNTRFD